MNNYLGQVAGLKALLTVYDLTSASKKLVNDELNLIKTPGLSFVECLTKLSGEKRYQSIICCALSRHDKRDEEIVSQSLLSLQEASIKYFEEERTINFKQFAIIYIRKYIYELKNKQNNTNGSDVNELIHSAIKIIKKCNKRKTQYLLYHEAKHLAEHFNLNKNKGIKKVFQLETIQFGNVSDWAVDKAGEEYYRLDDQEKDISDPNYRPSNSIETKSIDNQHLNILKKQSQLFLKSCNSKQSIVFKKELTVRKKLH